MRGSTSTACASPLTSSSMRMRRLAALCASMMARTASVVGGAPAIGGRRVQVGRAARYRRARRRRPRAPRLAHRCACRPAPLRRASSRSGNAVTAPMPTREAPAHAVLVERNLRRRRHKGEVARRALTSWKPVPMRALGPDREPHRGEAARRGSAVIIGPRKKSGGRDLARLGAVAIGQRRVERDRDQRDLGRRIGIGERAADGAARARRRMADPRHRPWRAAAPCAAHERIALDARIAAWSRRSRRRRRPSRTKASAGDAGDVDEPRRPRQPHRHQRNQRLPAGDEARAVVGREQRAGFVNAGGPGVFERGRFHSCYMLDDHPCRRHGLPRSGAACQNARQIGRTGRGSP